MDIRLWMEGNLNSFFFSLKDDFNFGIFRCTEKKEEVHHDEDLLCCFGRGDFNIVNDCNINYKNKSKLGEAFEKPSENEEFALAGSEYFKVLEMEVYKVL